MLWTNTGRLPGVVQKTLSCVPTEALLSIWIQESPLVCKQKDRIFAMAISSVTEVLENWEWFYCTKIQTLCF